MGEREVYDLFKVELEVKEATEEIITTIAYSVGIASIIDEAGRRAEFDKKIQDLTEELLLVIQEVVENGKESYS